MVEADPDVAITGRRAEQPAHDSGDRHDDGQLRFTSTNPDATFECSLDLVEPFAALRLGRTYENVPYGEHEFAVQAVAPLGTRSLEPAVFTWASGTSTRRWRRS